MLMSWYPALPPWDGLHPAVVQFPLALLMAAPFVVLASVLVRPSWRALAFTAFGLMLAGTFALWVATGTGHAAGQLVERTPELERAIVRHEALGSAARGVFAGLTLLYALFLLVPLWLKRSAPDGLRTGIQVVFLVLYVACTGVLAQAANAGGHLVHQYGIRAMVQPPDTTALTPVAQAEHGEGR